MKHYINCPFKDKEEVMALGGHWDYKVRKWYYISDKVETRFDKWQGTKSHLYDNHLERLSKTVSEHSPFIVFDIETTGIMNGNDNRITQMALVAYSYNEESHKYEMKDHLFMLAKANPSVIEAIKEVESGRNKAIISKLEEEYFYSLPSVVKKYEEEILQLTAECDELSLEYAVSDTADKKQELSNALQQKNYMMNVKQEFLDEYYGLLDNCQMNLEFVSKTQNCGKYVAEHFKSEQEKIKMDIKIDDILSAQGINQETWLKTNDGLTVSEMQLGLSAFLKNNFTRDTTVLTNGVKYAKYYLDKENLQFTADGKTRPFKAIDTIRAAKTYSDINIVQESKFTCNFTEFAEVFKANTGKEIKCFDAFTKVLCMAEMACRITGTAVVHNSEKQIRNSVNESAMSEMGEIDTNGEIPCVLTDTAVNSLMWNPENTPYYSTEDGTRIFDALEYVDFGNDRRYVDIDKLFEVNENFEITLEGEKEPIKSWDELETKIKSYNTDISEELLFRIKTKYTEIETSLAVIRPGNIVPVQDSTIDRIPETEYQISTKFQDTLENKLLDFDFKLLTLEEESKRYISDYQQINTAITHQINEELPFLKKFVDEVTNKMQSDTSINTSMITCDITDETGNVDTVCVSFDKDENAIKFFIGEGMVKWNPQTSLKAETEECLCAFIDNYDLIKNNIINTLENRFEDFLKNKTKELVSLQTKVKKLHEKYDQKE